MTPSEVIGWSSRERSKRGMDELASDGEQFASSPSCSSSSSENSPSLCAICLEPGAAQHYGASTCGSCKIFFMRSTKNASMLNFCKNSGQCVSLLKCKSCRYQKCLQAGMIPDAVNKKLKQRLFVVPYFSKESAGMVRSVSFDLSSNDDPAQVLKMLLQTEKICNNDNGEYHLYINFFTNIDLTIEDALRSPGSVCPRTPMSYASQAPRSFDSVALFKQLYCRITRHFLEYVCVFEEIWQLSEKDRKSLLKANGGAMCMTTLCYYTYKFKLDGIVFGHGYMLSDKTDETCEYNRTLVQFGQTKIISTLKKLRLTEEEYLFLKNIVLFTTSPDVSLEGTIIIGKARNRYTSLLLENIRNSRADLDSEQMGIRVREILSLVKKIQQMALFDDSFLMQMTFKNTDGMRGTLTSEFHL